MTKAVEGSGARRRGELRNEIIDAADRLLLETADTREVSIDAVVDAVGCTPPALYYYFPSKDLLLWEVCRRRYEAFAAELEASIPATADALAELLARGHAYLDWAVAHPEHYRLLFMTALDPPAHVAAVDPSQSAGLAELIDNVERAVAAGLLNPGDSLAMALALWSTVHGMASLAVVNPSLPRAFAHATIELTGRAVLDALGQTAGAP